MLWLWFVIGLIMTILGTFAVAYDDYIKIKNYEFDSEILGIYFLIIGGVLVGVMLVALGVNWCFRGWS